MTLSPLAQAILDMKAKHPLLSAPEIATLVGCNPAYAKMVLTENEIPAPPEAALMHRFSIRMAGPVMRAYRDRAELHGVSFDALIEDILKTAIETGTLDAHWPRQRAKLETAAQAAE